MAESKELFIKTLAATLDQKLEYIEQAAKETDALYLATKNNLKLRCEKMKETKKEINALKKGNEELERTLHDLRRSNSVLADYTELLKADTEKYRKETNEIAEDQNLRLEEANKTWKTFEVQYETLPLAVVRKKELDRLMKSKVELFVKQQKLSEMKKTISIQNEIDRKMRNNLVVDIVKLTNEIKLEDIQYRAVLDAGTKLEEQLRQQNAIISELERKREERLAAKQQKTVENSGKKRPESQNRLRYQLPRFDLSELSQSLHRPSLNLRKDESDNISVTSSIIDSLIELSEQETERTDGPAHSTPIDDHDKEEMTEAVRVLEERETANFDEEEEPHGLRPDDRQKLIDRPPKNPRPIQDPVAVNDLEKSFEMSEIMESSAMVEVRGNASLIPKRAPELPIAVADRDYYNPADEGRSELAESSYSEPIRGEGPQGLLELGEPEPKIPRISRIEKVQMNIPIGKKIAEDDSVREYFDGSDSNASFNWKPSRRLSSLFSNNAPDYQRGVIDTEIQSSVGSDNSMRIEDIMKEFRVACSPGRPRRLKGMEEYRANLRDAGNRAERQDESEAGPSRPLSQIGEPHTPVQFLSGFGNFGAPTDAEDPKKGQFFLSMF